MHNTDKTLFAPGCFGSALAYVKDDEVCQQCPFSADCAMRSEVAMNEMRDMFSVIGTKKRRDGSTTMSQKAESILAETGRSEDEIRAAFMTGTNPFSMRRGFLGDVSFAILNSGQITREFLTQVVMARREVRQSVADLYVRQAIQILRHCGAITVQKNVISVVKG